MASKNFIVKNDIELKGNLIFEGATKDANETTLTITNPTADRTITFPDNSGTISLTSHNHTLDSLSNVVVTGTPTDGQAIVWDTDTSKWINQTVDSFPSQSGNTGKFLQTNGTSVSWAFVDLSAYLTAESDTLETVTDRGATSTNAITISNTTQATSSTTGSLIISGGVGIAKDVWIDGNLYVAGTTTTENTQTVATHDNLIYLNAAQDSVITNAVGSGTYVTYTAENDYTPGMDIRVTGMNPAGYNISSADGLTVFSATATQFVVAKTTTGTFVSGGTAHAKTEANPDLGFAGGYYNAGYAHAGLFRDASDGVFKFFEGYTPEPDEAVNIDTTHASFTLADISTNAVFSNVITTADLQNTGQQITLNSGQTGTASLNASIVVDRGDEDNVAIRWSESANAWQFTNDGTVYQSFGAGGGGSSASSVSSSPPLDPEPNQVWQDLDNGRIYVFNGVYWVEVQQNGSLGLLRYLGASATAPATSIDGSALDVGEVYFDTVFNVMKVYDGTGWEDAFTAGSLSVSRWVYTATGGETTLSGDDDNDVTLAYTAGIEEVYLNGVKLIRTSDYLATDGEEITLEPLVAGSVVEVISYSGFTVANTYTKTEVDNLIQKQGVRWTEVAGAGTSITTLSGTDDYSNTLAYTPGTEQVFVNGILIVRGIDYTATNGTSVVLGTALVPGDVVEVVGNSAFSVANTYTKVEVDNKLNSLNSPTVTGNTSAAGNINPSASNTYDLGTTSLRWRNIYTQDLHLSNGIGDYTVVEGEEDLFLVNNKSGKSFKFALIEVDPSQVPPKSESN